MTGDPARYAAIAAARVPLNFGSLDFIANLDVVLQADVPVIDCVMMMIVSSAPEKYGINPVIRPVPSPQRPGRDIENAESNNANLSLIIEPRTS